MLASKDQKGAVVIFGGDWREKDYAGLDALAWGSDPLASNKSISVRKLSKHILAIEE